MILLSWVWLENFLSVSVIGAAFGDAVPVVSIHDTEGTLLISEDNLDGLTSAIIEGWTVPTTATYYIQVTSAVPSYDAIYELSWQATGRHYEMENEPNDQREADAVFGLNFENDTNISGLSRARFAGQLMVFTNTDYEDWFSFTGDAGDRIAVSAHTYCR